MSQVIREGLRTPEERETKLMLLRRELSVGEKQANDGEFVNDFSYESLLAKLDQTSSSEHYEDIPRHAQGSA